MVTNRHSTLKVTTEMTRRRVRFAITAVVAVVVAVWALPHAFHDWRYQFAGLANPVMGRPSPILTIAFGLVVSAVVIVIAIAARRRGAPASLLLVPLAVGWLAYAAGTGLAVAGGGQATHPGQLRYTFSGGIEHTETLAAVCSSAVGHPDLIADIEPDVDRHPAVQGLPAISLRHPATALLWDAGPDVHRFEIVRTDGTVPPPFEIAALADRPRPYMEEVSGPDPGQRQPPIGLLDAYDFDIVSSDDAGISGRAMLGAKRWHEPEAGEVRWVDLTIPNDPWPESFDLEVSWTCDATS